MNKKEILELVLTALFTGLIIAGSYIALPIGPVPVVLATLFVLLAGMLLGPKAGGTAVALFLLLGGVGLPVFSGGRAGWTVFMGTTGGYLFGYLAAAVVAGLIVNPVKSNGKVSLVRLIVATLAGTVIIFSVGVPFLNYKLGKGWAIAFQYGLTPFILGAFIKGAVAVILAKTFLPRIYKED